MTTLYRTRRPGRDGGMRACGCAIFFVFLACFGLGLAVGWAVFSRPAPARPAEAEEGPPRDWKADLGRCPIPGIPGREKVWRATSRVKVEVLGTFSEGEGRRVLVKLSDKEGPYRLTGHALLHYRSLPLARGEALQYLSTVEPLDLSVSEEARWPEVKSCPK